MKRSRFSETQIVGAGLCVQSPLSRENQFAVAGFPGTGFACER